MPPNWVNIYCMQDLLISMGNSFITEPILVMVDKSARVENTYNPYIGVTCIEHTFIAPDGNYAEDLAAEVYVDGQFAGLGMMLPPEDEDLDFWDEDPGYTFSFTLANLISGDREINWLIKNGDNNYTITRNLSVQESPLFDDLTFIESLWRGLYDRSPFPSELFEFSENLQNYELSREQVVEKLRDRREFVKARNILIGQKTFDGVKWGTVSEILENIEQTETVSEETRDDDGDTMLSATTVGMNEVVQASLNSTLDDDYFKNRITWNGEKWRTYCNLDPNR